MEWYKSNLKDIYLMINNKVTWYWSKREHECKIALEMDIKTFLYVTRSLEDLNHKLVFKTEQYSSISNFMFNLQKLRIHSSFLIWFQLHDIKVELP